MKSLFAEKVSFCDVTNEEIYERSDIKRKKKDGRSATGNDLKIGDMIKNLFGVENQLISEHVSSVWVIANMSDGK